ncbi:MAG: MCE family protein [Sandaracinaceae bacterium]|nr:MCE family protein [Sandaracinaceae bacterium]
MKEGSSELRVGIFVTITMIVGGILIFVIGGQSSIFASHKEYETVFESVDGLRGGSPVRVAGIEAGTVDRVEFGRDGQVHVFIRVRDDAAGFVREGSTASIGSKGLLGDQLIDLSVGQGDLLDEGSVIPTQERSLLTSFLGNTGEQAEGIVANIDRITGGLANTLDDEQVQQDLRDIVHNLNLITALVHENDGTVRRLLTDPQMADSVQQALVSLRDTSSELNQTMRGVRRIVGEVEHGDGSAHEVIYGSQLATVLANAATAVGEIATILRDIRTGDNNAHELLYGDEAGGLITNLNAMSADLRAIVADVRAGRGTIGGLLVDPSIYEDIKRLVGNLQRNEILRSLVRYSIREDAPRGQPPTPEPRTETSTPEEASEEPSE